MLLLCVVLCVPIRRDVVMEKSVPSSEETLVEACAALERVTGGSCEGNGEGETSTSSEERSALLDLYTSTDGPMWFNNEGWGKGDPCSDSWYGVFCFYGNVSIL